MLWVRTGSNLGTNRLYLGSRQQWVRNDRMPLKTISFLTFPPNSEFVLYGYLVTPIGVPICGLQGKQSPKWSFLGFNVQWNLRSFGVSFT